MAIERILLNNLLCNSCWILPTLHWRKFPSGYFIDCYCVVTAHDPNDLLDDVSSSCQKKLASPLNFSSSVVFLTVSSDILQVDAWFCVNWLMTWRCPFACILWILPLVYMVFHDLWYSRCCAVAFIWNPWPLATISVDQMLTHLLTEKHWLDIDQ